MEGVGGSVFQIHHFSNRRKACETHLQLISLNFVWKLFEMFIREWDFRFLVSLRGGSTHAAWWDEFTFDFYSSSLAHCGFPASPWPRTKRLLWQKDTEPICILKGVWARSYTPAGLYQDTGGYSVNKASWDGFINLGPPTGLATGLISTVSEQQCLGGGAAKPKQREDSGAHHQVHQSASSSTGSSASV